MSLSLLRTISKFLRNFPGARKEKLVVITASLLLFVAVAFLFVDLIVLVILVGGHRSTGLRVFLLVD